MALACRTINSVYQFFSHTQLVTVWDRMEPWLVTPRIHAVHHGRDVECIDKNYAGVFCFIDVIFGSYQPSRRGQRINFGITAPPATDGLMDIHLHEWRQIRRDAAGFTSWKSKLSVLLRGPGWADERKRSDD